ncbi:SDR family oxidoreductase [Microbacteriaceae bacterium VKM Ac-2854]|nr:SDR family oxidoreductase [Microbacteriaceae bacterium VKM Ac-2854]
MTEPTFTGRVALVVGGSGYIGREIARQLIASGATVALAARNPGRLAEASVWLGGVSTHVIDTGDDASVAAVVDAVLAEHGRLDVLINTAAPSARTLDPAKDADPAQVLAAIDGKAMGYLRCANAVIPTMRAAGYGRIVNVNGQNAFLSGSITAAARNGVVQLAAKGLADALAGSGVTVNSVNPGVVTEHPSVEVAPARPGESSPEQVAALVVFLASEIAGAISGETVAIGHRVRGVQ